MYFTEINQKWTVKENSEQPRKIGFPYDELIYRARDFSRAENAHSGFYRSETLTVEKNTTFPRDKKIFLQIEGARQQADVFVGGSCVATVKHPCKYLVDVSRFAGTAQTLSMAFSSHENAPRYTGLGLSGEIKLLSAKDELYIQPDGVFVVTESSAERVQLTVYVDVANESDTPRRFALMTKVFNERERRVGKRARKFRIRAHTSKRFAVPIKLTRRNEWSCDDAYIYKVTVELSEGENLLDEAVAPLGIRTARLDDNKGFMLGGRTLPLRGGVVSHDNGIIGACSVPPAEKRKAAVLKQSGFNSVRYIGVPTEAALEALDKAGITCIVDIFDELSQPKSVGDAHGDFFCDFKRIVESSVKTLRKHPCVIGYGVADCVAESYGRGEGAKLGREIVELIKSYDDTRFIVMSADEKVPTAQEMLALGVMSEKVKAAIKNDSMLSLAREKNSFRDLTADWFAAGDVAGYADLYQRYQTDRLATTKPIIGVASATGKIYDCMEETEKNGVLGDFVKSAIDALGEGEEEGGMSGERCGTRGDIDMTLSRKSRSYYRQICMGNRRVSKIVVIDPESENEQEAADGWNLARYLGKQVTVKVYTGGDVVALYLDGRLVGRKLAGKINKFVATFTMNYYPGKLEAVSFRKGAEYSRCYLESTTSPKMVKLTCSDKNLSLSGGNMAFVEIAVADKEGRAVTRAQRNIEVLVRGEGYAYALGSADPELEATAAVTSLPVYKGKALLAVRGTEEGKITVKVTSEGLLCGKISLKVKP